MSKGVCGTIKRIELENFMCHRHLLLDLSPQVNFIVGENGSGKSAILVALAICFGAKAQFTSRGKRAADVIKTGETYCKVIVHLNNIGDGSLDREKYGDTISFERKITKEGSGSYKVVGLIDGEKPRLVGNKASDVNEVLDHFNIPFDNPCILLMQETSKTFLTATKATDKYKFFLQATQLESVIDNYKLAEELCAKAQKQIDTKKEGIPAMEMQVDALKMKLEAAKSIKELKNIVKNLEAEAAWANVRDQCLAVKSTEQHCVILKTKINEFSQDVIENKIQQALQQIQNYNKQVGTVVNELKQLEEVKNDASTSVVEARKKLQNLLLEIEDKKNSLETTKKRVQLLKDGLEEAKSHDEKDMENAIQDKNNKIRLAEIEIEKCKKSEESTREELKPLEVEMQEKARRYGGVDDDYKKLKNRIVDEEKNLQNLKNQKRDVMAIYHQNMPLLLKEIAQTTFEYEVVGPIGEQITLKDTKWNHAVENCVKRATLASFIVRSENDKRKLRELGQKTRFDVQVFVYNIKYGNNRYQTNKQKYQSLLDVIDIRSTVAFNVLVDHIKIDAVAVAINRGEGKGMMNLGAKQIYLQNGSLMQRSGQTEGFFPYRIPQQSLYARKDVNLAITESEDLLKHMRADLAGNEAIRNDIDKERSACNKQIAKVRTRLRLCEKDTRSALSKKKEAENITIKEMADVEELEENYNTFLEKAKKLSDEINEKIARKKELKDDVENKRMELEKSKVDIKSKEGEMRLIHKSSAELGNNIETWQEEKMEGDSHLQLIKQQYEKVAEELSEQQTRLYELKEVASEFKYVETNKTVEMILREKAKCEKKQEEINKERIDYDEVERDFEKKSEQLERINKQLCEIRRTSKVLEAELEKRKTKYKYLLRQTSTKTIQLFEQYLKKKPGCSGRVRLDHTKKELDIEVSLNSQKERDAKTLSGGEKSFSTVCLLLSLWNVVDCPFRAMDEFDVYMDSISRKIAIETLMETVQSAGRRQYIFITPQNLDGVNSTDTVKVFMIRKPQREHLTQV
ncbi:structural maintenance of chromosomes protein, putative [Entamoeba invadens IP1]|uniref:structural maintenance of chromosomes protein, putative n=1 Tax=Entamoeba invadens IP1 TaxID=370355 RepID=UPI0002C3DDBF|nr:structural maintenance of chromosomes protein, putative [Entamoeba invadens IP1]ELP93381.1 structural maintenance of chromosomes protein, putative [Entamoeba invadens IP1]|eukprot:XP_004260152.1 structural maintenance of chromosomes protein, putative [Entamoeba invadens IP1]